MSTFSDWRSRGTVTRPPQTGPGPARSTRNELSDKVGTTGQLSLGYCCQFHRWISHGSRWLVDSIRALVNPSGPAPSLALMRALAAVRRTCFEPYHHHYKYHNII